MPPTKQTTLPKGISALQFAAIKKQARATSARVANDILQTANKYRTQLLNQITLKTQFSRTTLQQVWDEKAIDRMMACASFLSWCGLRNQAGLETLGTAGMFQYALHTPTKDQDPKTRSMPGPEQ